MAGTPKNKLNKIRGEMERDNKEVHAYHGVDLVAFLLRAKNQVESWYKRAKGTTNVLSIDMKKELLNFLGKDIRERIEIGCKSTNKVLRFSDRNRTARAAYTPKK